MCNESFEAVVTASKNVGFSRAGEQVVIKAHLPERTRDVQACKFDTLQASYNGELSIRHEHGTVVIERTIVACTAKTVLNAKRSLAGRIRSHLDIDAVTQ